MKRGCIRQGALNHTDPSNVHRQKDKKGQEGWWVQTASTSWNSKTKPDLELYFFLPCFFGSWPAAGFSFWPFSVVPTWLLRFRASENLIPSCRLAAWREDGETWDKFRIWCLTRGEEADGRCSSLSPLAPAVLRPHRPASCCTRPSAVLSCPSSFAAAFSAAPAWFLAPAGKFGSSVSIPSAGLRLRSTPRGRENLFWVCRHTA